MGAAWTSHREHGLKSVVVRSRDAAPGRASQGPEPEPSQPPTVSVARLNGPSAKLYTSCRGSVAVVSIDTQHHHVSGRAGDLDPVDPLFLDWPPCRGWTVRRPAPSAVRVIDEPSCTSRRQGHAGFLRLSGG